MRWPLTGLIAGICSVVAMRVAELTTGGWLWPVTLLYVSVVLGPRPRLRLVVGIAAVQAVWAFNLEWAVLQHSASRTVAGIGPEVLWLTAALAVTVAIGNWRRWTRAAIQQQRAEVEQQRTAERLRVAREVHDTVAHTLAVVGVHLNVAADALDTAPDEARAALRLAQDVRRKAMGDLSSLVGVLRDDRRPTAEPLDLEALVAQVRAAGLDARLHVDGADAALPVRTAVGLVVREALTNTVRHAAARTVTVTVHYGPTTEVTVADDGTGSGAPVRARADRDAGAGRGARRFAHHGRCRGLRRTRDNPVMTVHVLLADDQALVRAGFSSLLRRTRDVTVVGEASTGDEAVRQARRLRPDVVLMDIRMPGLDGIDGDRADRRRPRPRRHPGRHPHHVRDGRARVRGAAGRRERLPHQGGRARRAAPRGPGRGGRRGAAVAERDRPGDRPVRAPPGRRAVTDGGAGSPS